MPDCGGSSCAVSVPTISILHGARSRSTIASQLYNAREPMTLFELQEWLGHSTPTATQHYAKITPLKVAKSYADAGYFRALGRWFSVSEGDGRFGTRRFGIKRRQGPFF